MYVYIYIFPSPSEAIHQRSLLYYITFLILVQAITKLWYSNVNNVVGINAKAAVIIRHIQLKAMLKPWVGKYENHNGQT